MQKLTKSMHSKHVSLRDKQGSIIGLVAVFATILILCIYASLQASVLLGGSQEVRNSVDAGALNVAKHSIDIAVQPSGDFADCANSHGGITMVNINRVWGKAYLVNANTEAMTRTDQGSYAATYNAALAFQDAQQINDDLFTALNDTLTRGQHFEALNRSAKMLGPNATVTAAYDNDWSSALMNRGGESNLSFDQKQLPPGGSPAPTPVSKGGRQYLQGYEPLTMNNKHFYFVSFALNEMPHLVSARDFTPNRSDTMPIPSISNPIPNAFVAHGMVSSVNNNMIAADAFAIANPQRQYTLAIPHAFVSIQINNIANWYIMGKKVNETVYGLAPETQWGVRNNLLACGGTLNGYASLGNEYKSANNLWQSINSLPGDYIQLLTNILQRIQQVKPGYTQAELIQLLTQQTLTGGARRYIIYPKYNTLDATNPTIEIGAAPNVAKKIPWLKPNIQPEGLAKNIITEGQMVDLPNYCWQTLNGGNCQQGGHRAVLSGEVLWQPGTGYDQSLGEIKINHTTDCYFQEQ